MISLSPFAWVAVVGMLMAGGYYVVDRIGDYREEQVWRKIKAAVDRTNADISKQNVADDKAAGDQEAARQKALAAMVPVMEKCPASAALAKSLSEVK